MRLFVGIRVKNSVAPTNFGRRFEYVRLAQEALDAIQPWPSTHTTRSEQWVPYVGRTALLTRSNEPVSIPERHGLSVNGQKVWAWSGVLGKSVLEAFETFEPGERQADSSIWGGIGSYAVVGVTDGSLVAYTNAHRSEALYWTEFSDCVVVSNSAAALALMRGEKKIEYSRLGIAGFIMHGLPVTETTPFMGIEILPAGGKLLSDMNADMSINIDEGDQQFASLPYNARVDSLAESLVDYAKLLSREVAEVRAAATGGKDSRLVLATLKAAEVTFGTYTGGLPESGEVVVGKQVSDFLGVPHTINRPPVTRDNKGNEVIVAEPEVQAWRTLRSTNGIGNTFTMLPDPFQEFVNPLSKANFGGQGGEIIRGGYIRYLNSDIPTPERTREILEKHWTNNADLLLPFAQEAVLADLRPIFEMRWKEPGAPLFHGYVSNRTGRWLATMRHGESVVHPHSTLLINNLVVRRLKSFSIDEIRAERVAHSLMKNLAPGIQDIPFFRDRWAFEMYGPSEFYDPSGWSRRAPYTAHRQPRANFNWRTVYTPRLSSFFKNYILDSPDSMIFDIVDRDAVERMLDGKRYRAPAAWALFSAQYMLNEAWLGAQSPADPVRIEIPVP